MPSDPIALSLGRFCSGDIGADLPPPVAAMVRRLVIDIAGLCVAARNTDYVAAALASAEGRGKATVLGHKGAFTAIDAALINGTAAHGEDFDDTFEGGPVHAGAPVVPAVLAVAERDGIAGTRITRSIAIGVEIMCRGSLVAPQGMHKACFHPTAILGAIGATAAVAALKDLSPEATARALGIAGSMASGIIEYLADGASTKRLHAGLAAQSGIRAVALAEAGFTGPLSVFEGTHGLYRAFAHPRAADFSQLTDDLGQRWTAADLAFKPYACGTMTQPFVDCAVMLAKRGLRADDIASLVCEVGEGTVHRLWEPLALKQNPPNGYAAKFSSPDCIAAGFIRGEAGLAAFDDSAVLAPARRSLAAKVSYVIDPANEYPRNYTGHIRATMKDGSVIEVRQPHMRGGARDPLSDAEILEKYRANCRYGGFSRARADALLQALEALVAGGTIDLRKAKA